MRIDLKTFGFKSGRALKDFVARRISAALAHGADQLRWVVVRLLDENGPRGGLDKVCRVELVYRHREPLLVTAVSSDYYTAVEAAARRAGRASNRLLERQRF
jgi:putative sigma-54 modulation protein